MATKKTRNFPWFYTILSLFLLLGICGVAYGLSWLRSWMEDYELSQPKYVAREIFETYFANPDVEAFIKEGDYTVSPAESFEDLKNYVTQQIGTGEITYNESSSSIDGKTLKYVVSAGDYKFAQFTVVDSGERTEFNNTVYKLGEYNFFYVVKETHSVKITAPSDAKVTVNGFVLDESYITATKETDSCIHMPSNILHNDNTAQGIKYSTYVLDGLINPTEDIKVVDKYEEDCKVLKQEDGTFSAEINYNSSLEELHGSYAVDFAKGYAKYAQGCGTFNEFGDMVDSESSLYYKIKTLQNQFVHAHDTCEFTEEKAFEFYEYAPDVFSCRVSFTWHAYRQNAPEAYEYIDMTLYFHKVNGEYKIYDMMTHSDFTK